MKTKIFNGSKRTALAIAVLMFTLSIIGGLASIFSTKAFAVGEKVNIVYSSSDFNYEHNKSYTDDAGKSGIQFSTVKTGDAAEGSSFSFGDTMTGTFDMDFRVESQKKYAYASTASGGWTHYLTNGKQKYLLSDYINPYADLQELAIKFTSATNPNKYFIVYIFGASDDVAFTTAASVYVNGDSIWEYNTKNEKLQHGYGLTDGVQNYVGGLPYGLNDLKGYQNIYTKIYATSFSNFAAKASGDATEMPTTSNLIKFDPTTMEVFVNGGSGYSSINTTANVLVRNVATNAGFNHTPSDASWAVDDNSKLISSISPSDFANGYSVSVEFANVTSNSTVGNGSYFGGSGNYCASIPAYDRTPKMTVYSVNGKSLIEENVNLLNSVSNRETKDYIDYNESDFTVTENYLNTLDNKSGLRIQSVQSGVYAQDKGFTLTDKMLGNFDLDFRINSKETYAHTASAGWPHYLTNGWQKALMSDYSNPYADVQEVAFKFISATDPDKYFIVYIMGTAADLAFATSASVMVNGDNMFSYGIDSQTGDNIPYYRGYGLNGGVINYIGGSTWGSAGVAGYQAAFTKVRATSFSNFTATSSDNGTSAPTTSNLIKFNPETMEVFVNAGKGGNTYSTVNTNADVLVRNIATNAGYTWANTSGEVAPVLGSIQPEDFANGYSVEVAFTRVTDNNTVGDSSKFGGASQYPTIIETPYERYVDMTIYSLNGRDLGTSSVADDGKPVVTSPVAKMEKGVEVDLAPLFYDAIGGNTVGIYGTVEVSYNGGEFTTIANNGNKYLYTPTEKGTYTVRYSNFIDGQGNKINVTTANILSYVPTFTLTYGDNTATIEKDTLVNLSEYASTVANKQLIGWVINGELYSADYSFTMTANVTANPIYLGFALENGAYIRIVVGENAGIRFIAKVNGADLDALIALVGEESLTFVYNMTANGITKTQTKSYEEFLTITEFDADGNYSTAVAITDVKVNNAGVLWTGEIALKIAYVNGESTISAGQVSRSVQELASALKNDAQEYNALSPEKQAIVNQYAGN